MERLRGGLCRLPRTVAHRPPARMALAGILLASALLSAPRPASAGDGDPAPQAVITGTVVDEAGRSSAVTVRIVQRQ